MFLACLYNSTGSYYRHFDVDVGIDAGILKLCVKVFTTVELQWLEHRWLVYHGCFELILESHGKRSHRGDSNENTQHTYILKKIEKIIPIMPSDLAL